jgi:hypothetical protein
MSLKSEIDVDGVQIHGALWMHQTLVAAGALTAEGVFVLDADTSAPQLVLETGLVLHGLSARDAGEDVTPLQAGRLLTVSCESDAGAALVIESPAVVDDEADRFSIAGGNVSVVGIDRRPIQVLFSGTLQRWVVPDWSGRFTTTWAHDGATWHTLANLGTVPDGGAWSVGADMLLRGDDGTLYASRCEFSAVAKRPSGGGLVAPAGTDYSTSEVGDLAGADLRIAASGNDLLLQANTTLVADVTALWTVSILRG